MKPGFVRGLGFWVRGWGFLLRDRWLILFALVPFLLAVAVAGYSMSFVFHSLPAWVTNFVALFLSPSSSWFDWLYYPFWVASAVLILVSGIVVAYLGHALISIPFYALLADRTLTLQGAKRDEPLHFGKWLRNSLRMLRVGLMKTALFIAIGVVLFVLSFVPIVNIPAMFGALMIVAFDQLDYSFEALHLGLRQRIGFAASHSGAWAGMACGLGLTLLIPGLTLVIAPGAVVGAALLIKESGHGSQNSSR